MRLSFQLVLLHPNTIRQFYQSIDWKARFTHDTFAALSSVFDKTGQNIRLKLDAIPNVVSKNLNT